jgi:hypothetical protein
VPPEGRFAIVTARWRGLRWTLRRQAGFPAGRKRLRRTAKSCGPGAATLALPAGACSRTTGARKAASPGRARISRKTIARGRPGCLGCTCSFKTRVLSCATLARGSTGAVSARLSLRPLFKREQRIAKLRRNRAVRMRAYVYRFGKLNCRPGQASDQRARPGTHNHRE